MDYVIQEVILSDCLMLFRIMYQGNVKCQRIESAIKNIVDDCVAFLWWRR